MTTNTITRTVAGATLLLLAVAGLACETKAAASESSYCDAARQWSVYEITPRNDEDPKAYKQYWTDYLAFMDKGTRLSPPPIHDDWAVYNASIQRQTPVVQKYAFDHARFEAGATPDEQALFSEPGAKVEQAFTNVLRYEALTCSAGQPPAADVKFSGDKESAYCHVVAEDYENVGQLRESGFRPADVKKTILSEHTKQINAHLAATAPESIRDDVRANVGWWKHQQTKVLAKYGYDMRKILLEGSAQDRADLQLTDKRIRDHFARTLAYEQQVCGQ